LVLDLGEFSHYDCIQREFQHDAVCNHWNDDDHEYIQ